MTQLCFDYIQFPSLSADVGKNDRRHFSFPSERGSLLTTGKNLTSCNLHQYTCKLNTTDFQHRLYWPVSTIYDDSTDLSRMTVDESNPCVVPQLTERREMTRQASVRGRFLS